MSRFNQDFRDSFPNKVCRHFDKYCEITTPVNFDAIADIYQTVFSRKEWASLSRLLETKLGRECLTLSTSFDLYLGNSSQPRYDRMHVCFGFPDGVKRPSLNIEYADIPNDVRGKLDRWMTKNKALKQLRKELYRRVDRLLDWGWEKDRNWGSDGKYRGGPEPGQGCNTPGQVDRIWPELLAFFPADEIAKVRGASCKSRMPQTIVNYGTPGQFRCEESWFHREDDTPYTEEEMIYEKRKFDALTHILVQMSLMTDVPHVKGYPNVVG